MSLRQSTDFLVGESVTDLEGFVFTKKSNEFKIAGEVRDEEIWLSENGDEYTPTSTFINGNSAPAFNRLLMG